nr:RusA family crossover junction endodeoxyribonuclease [uncultured Rhodopila sp.]
MARRTDGGERPDDRRPPDFEICVHGRPVSAQAHNRNRLAIWQHAVKTAALDAWPSGQQPFAAEIELRVTHYAGARIADMDNLVKPIQDALQGVCYPHDGRVDVTGNWRDINGRFRVRYMSPRLAAAFSDGREFVHVRVWRAAGERDLG